jgi:hypothetical protein
MSESSGREETFRTARPGNPLFCHQDFLEKLADHSRDATGRRAGFLMQRLAVDIGRLHYKSTSGVNRGWRRSRLGGGQGSHFYAWWAPKDAPPFKDHEDFAAAPDGALILRDIRHHDDHSPLTPQMLATHYLPLTIADLRRDEYAPSPWNQNQARFAAARQPVRILKGHPGSGKTTALWHAADSTGAPRVLYVTYSSDLAALARNHFDRYCSAERRFQVITFPNLIRQILGRDIPHSDEHESRRAFLRDLMPFARNLGIWSGHQVALYDELHAHMVGDALPVAIGRFTACKQPRVSDAAYRDRRSRFLGPVAAPSAIETAVRLERLEPTSLAERYFPELALAWQALEKLRGGDHPAFREFDCIAVDECQDLTPIETLVIIQLAVIANRGRRTPVPLLLAGDEAQTVRPTDFEWGWLNDLLHGEIGTPAEYHLKSNLRSPRRIAELVNRIWDLYSHLEKHERPSGAGYAEIDDDATDQILYCTGVPGADLHELLSALSAREGLALITLDDTVPSFVPESVRPTVLTAAEAKGLDFHSVCILDPGRHVARVTHRDDRVRAGAEIDSLYKRLAIDQLRVAVSRASERLIWLDINPAESTVRQSLEFLNGGRETGGIASCVPSAVLRTIEEEQLDVEERIQRCQSDARQYLRVKPEMAFSRAWQAVTLLGPKGAPASVTDPTVRNAAHLTAAEICYSLACRQTRLAAELGNPDLFTEAHRAALQTARVGLPLVISCVDKAYRDTTGHIDNLVMLARMLACYPTELEPWILVEIEARSRIWIEELESAVMNGLRAPELIQILPPFYEVLGVQDGAGRTARLRQRAIQLLMKDRQFGAALDALALLPERQPKLEALCYEGLRDFRKAAERYQAAGDLKSALNCYRTVPDLAAALQLLPKLDAEYPAKDTLEWMARMQQLIAERPDKFNKTVTPAEKKLLEEMLERALGVKRRVAAPKTKRTPAVRKDETNPSAKVSTKAATRPKPTRGESDEEFF